MCIYIYVYTAICACVLKLLQSCPTLCDNLDCSSPGSSFHGILQARILELPCPPPGDLPNVGIKPTSLMSPALAGGFLTTSTTWEAPCTYIYTYVCMCVCIYCLQQLNLEQHGFELPKSTYCGVFSIVDTIVLHDPQFEP